MERLDTTQIQAMEKDIKSINAKLEGNSFSKRAKVVTANYLNPVVYYDDSSTGQNIEAYFKEIKNILESAVSKKWLFSEEVDMLKQVNAPYFIDNRVKVCASQKQAS